MLLLLALLFLSVLLFWNFLWKRRGLPPGPVPLPLLGNAFAISRSKCPYAPYQQWSRQFGHIYTVWLGEAPVVVVTDFELMRELFVKDGDTYAGRHFLSEITKVFTASRGMLYGVIRTEGELWKETRRFALQIMRNLGMGRARLEERFLKDIDETIGRVRREIALADEQIACKESSAVGIQLNFHIDRLVGSTINQVLFGHAFSDDQLEDFHGLKHEMDSQTKIIDSAIGKSLIGMPFLRHFPPFCWTFDKLDNNLSNVFVYIDKTIAKRLEEREQKKREGKEKTEEANDLLNCFLDQMEKEENGGEDTQSQPVDGKQYINMENLRVVCFDLFLAGQETTSVTLNFIVLYLLLDQRVQQKMQTELDKLAMEKRVNGGMDDDDDGGMFTMADRAKLPYVNAVINESQRMCNLLPLNLTHRTMADVQIEGKCGKLFRLARGTNIVPQISCVLFDEKVFANSRRFLPERFLNENGQLERCEQLIPFGLGKRICMGESLSRMELFLFTANFFRHFHVLPVDPLNPPSSKKQKSFLACPFPYKCRIEVRKIK